MSIVFGNSESFTNCVELPEIDFPCTISVMLVDYITNGQNNFFMSRQWQAKQGLHQAKIKFQNELVLLNANNDQKLINKIDNQLASWDNFTKLVITINELNDKEIYKFEEEYINIPDIEILETLLLAKSQFSGDCKPLLSFNRFLTFATYKNPVVYKDKKIFISGCGTGAEVLICKKLGASYCIGYDIDHSSINFASNRFKNVDGIQFTTNIAGLTSDFDLIISRHVIEHIPKNDWNLYFIEMADLLKQGGEILIDMPNQRNPRESHTGLLFFHLLDKKTKEQIVEYCDITKPVWYKEITEKMKVLIHHENIILQDILDALPPTLIVRKTEFIDNNCETYSGDRADDIRIYLSKL